MRLYINKLTGELIKGVGFSTPVKRIHFKRGNTARIEVLFVELNAVVELAEGATGVFGLKLPGKYDDDYIVVSQEWVKEELSEGVGYVFEPDFNTDELNEELGHDGEVGNDKSDVELMGEIAWEEGVKRDSTVEFEAIVANDINKGNEGLPTSASTEYYNKVLSDERFLRHLPSITGLTGGGGVKLDGIEASALVAGRHSVRLYLATGAGGAAVVDYRLLTLGAAESSPWRIKPDDDATKAWILERVTIDGCPAVWNPDTSAFHRLLGSGGAGNVTLTPEQTQHVIS